MSPDLFLYAVLSRFEGYFPGYSSLPAQNPNCLTWVVLKAHTNNTAGDGHAALGRPARRRRTSTSTISTKATIAHGEDLKAVVDRRVDARAGSPPS